MGLSSGRPAGLGIRKRAVTLSARGVASVTSFRSRGGMHGRLGRPLGGTPGKITRSCSEYGTTRKPTKR